MSVFLLILCSTPGLITFHFHVYLESIFYCALFCIVEKAYFGNLSTWFACSIFPSPWISLSFLVVIFDIIPLVRLFSMTLFNVSEMLGVQLWDVEESHGQLVEKVGVWIPTSREFY